MEEGKNREVRSMVVQVPAGEKAGRLDKYLATSPDCGLSRTHIQRLITERKILVDGRPATHNHFLKGGETIQLTIPPPRELDFSGEDIPIDIVYEDEYLAVVNKPAGLVTHPAVGNYSGTLVNALVHHFGELPSASGDRPGIVHRLDKNTSGLLMVAKQEEVLLKLQRAIQMREIKRTYCALICGHMQTESGTIDLPVGRSTNDRTKMAVTQQGSRTAITEYRLLDRFRSYDLLDVTLQTGRTHQIRVHFSHLGHAVFGDPEYGGRETWRRGMFAPERPLAGRLLKLIDRQALHARRLEFAHPATGNLIVCEKEPPEDFQTVLAVLGAEGR
jgi:23S rRNA pseudouridine1911/1915/1917 synthase